MVVAFSNQTKSLPVVKEVSITQSTNVSQHIHILHLVGTLSRRPIELTNNYN